MGISAHWSTDQSTEFKCLGSPYCPNVWAVVATTSSCCDFPLDDDGIGLCFSFSPPLMGMLIMVAYFLMFYAIQAEIQDIFLCMVKFFLAQ